MAGQIVMTHAQNKGVLVLPVDSEHNAIFQCLEGETKRADRKSDLDRVRRPVPTVTRGSTAECHQGGRPAASDVENGPKNHHRFGDALQ